MVQTRSQRKPEASEPKSQSKPQRRVKRSQSKTSVDESAKPPRQKKTKTGSQEKAVTEASDGEIAGSGASQLPEKRSSELSKERHQKIAKLLQQYGELPLHSTGLENPSKATPATLLALLLNAILSSTRISHGIAARTVEQVIKEKTATILGELAEMIEKKFGGDLNNILTKTSRKPVKIRAQMQSIKGLGDVGIGIFFDTAQHVWPCLAPFIDPRSVAVAKNIGLGEDVQDFWEAVGKKPEKMTRLANALTRVRLEKLEEEFKT